MCWYLSPMYHSQGRLWQSGAASVRDVTQHMPIQMSSNGTESQVRKGQEIASKQLKSVIILYANSFILDEHRLNYGKCFKENKYQHFPDCAFFLNVSPRPICSWCGDIFSNLPLLFKHLRGHKLKERTDDEKQKQNYCETCQTQIMSSQHENNHRKSIAKTKTVPCIFCSKRVFRFYLDRHTSAAHHNQLFRYMK